MVQDFLGGVVREAAERMPDPRQQEQQNECEAEGMFIEPEDPAASPDGPRRLRIIGEVTGIGIHELLGARSSRFR
jgi:hypothetical protein